MNKLKSTLQELDRKLDTMIVEMFERLRKKVFEDLDRRVNGPKDFPSEADRDLHNRMLAGNRRLNGPSLIPFADFRANQ